MSTEYSLPKRAVAEFIGTFSIVFFGAGAVTIDLMTAPESAGGTYVLDGLGHGALGWMGIAFAFWVAIAIPIYVFGRVSGQHINPAVTIALWVTKHVESRVAAIYVAAQFAGGIAGGVVFTLIRGSEAVTIGSMGATAPFPGVEPWQALLAEVVITFFLMVTIMALAVDDRGPSDLAGLGIGLVIAGGVVTTGNISGASFNPARTIGPYVTNSAFGGPNLWAYAWIYVAGPLVGAIAGVYCYQYLVGVGADASTEPDETPDRPAGDAAAGAE